MNKVLSFDRPLPLISVLDALSLSDWLHLDRMFRVIDKARKEGRPVSQFKVIASRLEMIEPTFTKFRQRVAIALKQLIPSDEEILDSDRVPTETGVRAWELADWVARVVRETHF